MNPTTHPLSVTRIAAATLAALALASPAAIAKPIRESPSDATPTPPVTVQATDESFDWGSAGIGAAATGGLVLVALGGFATARRARIGERA
jgi:hypothetical protein